jgi:hypothetical protein
MILSSSLVKPALLEVFTIEPPKFLGQYAVGHNVVNYVFRSRVGEMGTASAKYLDLEQTELHHAEPAVPQSQS